MDAPLYRPAIAYERPVVVATPLNVETSSMAALMADPAAKAIVVKAVPVVTFLQNVEQMKPQWDNVSLRSLTVFGIVTPEIVDKVELQLRALPQGAGK